MSLRYSLEDFGDATSVVGHSAEDAALTLKQSDLNAQFEARKLEGYEAGYKTGWDDAAASMKEGSDRVKAEFARNLEDLGFTYQEARSHVLSTLEPLLTQLLTVVLPKALETAIGPIVSEAMMPMAEELADGPIQVLISPINRASLEVFLEKAVSVPFEIIEKDTLPDGQIYLRSGKSECCVDLSEAVSRITQAVETLYHVNEKAFQHG